MRESPTIPLIEGLLAAGARVQTHDPKATDSARAIFGDRVMYAADPYSAAHGADALLVMTEWLVYRNPDFERVRKLLRRPLLIDGRNLYDPGPHDRARLRVPRDRTERAVTRVLVTGAAGFIGSHLVEALARRGDEVVGIDNFDPFYARAMKERNLRGDGPRCRASASTSRTCWTWRRSQRLLTPDTVIVHLAARAGVRPSLADPVGYAQANVTGTAAVLEAARRAGVSRIAFGSSSSVYGDSTPAPFREDAAAVEPVSPYAATKRAGELLLRAVAPIYGFRCAALRFFTVYGPRQRPDLAIHAFARRMVDGRGRSRCSATAPRRATTPTATTSSPACIAAIDWTATAPIGLEPFNLGGNRSVPTGDMVAEIARALGIEPRLQWGPMQPGDVQRTAADLTKSGAVLGYAPVTPFPEGIRRFVAWFREAYGRSD